VFSCLLTEYKLLDTQTAKVMVAPKRLVSKGVVYYLFFLKVFPKSPSLEWLSVQVSLKSDPRRVLFSNVSNPKLFDPAEEADPKAAWCGSVWKKSPMTTTWSSRSLATARSLCSPGKTWSCRCLPAQLTSWPSRMS
jgi:hypothetical protein